MSTGPSVTALAKLAVGPSSPLVTALNFKSFDPGVSQTLVDTNGVRGTFWKDNNRLRLNRTIVQPKFTTEPTAPELATLLQWILSGTPSGTSYPWSNTPYLLNVGFAPNNGDQWLLGNVAVDTAVLRCSSGQALEVDLTLLGQTESNTFAYPALTFDQSLQPFILSDLVLTFNGSSYAIRSWEIAIDNGLAKDRFLNSLTLTALVKYHATVKHTFELPSGVATAIWNSGITGVALNAVFSNPNNSDVLTINCANANFPPRSPTFALNDEGWQRFEGEASRTTTSDPFTFTLVST